MNTTSSVLILHGWNVNPDRYIKLKNLITSKDINCYVPIMPGFFSNKNEKSYDLDDYVNFVYKFIKDNCRGNLTVVGHSFGGRVAIKLVYKYPKLVNRLVLTGVPGYPNDRKGFRNIIIYTAKLFNNLFSLLHIEFIKNKFRNYFYRLIGIKDYSNANEFMKITFKNILKENLNVYMDKILTKTILIWGDNDNFVGINIAKKMNATIKNSKLIILSGGHNILFDSPQEFLLNLL